ncbi:MAG TPA: helix-turn-helix transcriptional regulator [Acetobacteraceae bacterium]|nr:helix-turn-helix transcriptional regulator [Acetobacteraceae bacterium]
MRLLQDPALLAATIGSIYDCVLEPERWEAVLAGLGGLIGARRGFLGIATAGGETRGRICLHGLQSVEDATRHATINPLLPLGLVQPPDRAYVVSRDYGLSTLMATRFYREVLAPRADLDSISFVVMREGDAFAHWILITQDDRAPITAEEAAGFELIAPHIRRAVEISNVLGMQRLAAESYRAALGQLDAAVLILDGGRRPAYANARAETVLGTERLLRVRQGRVQGATEGAERALRRATEGTMAGGAAGFEEGLAATDGEEWLLFAVALDPGGDDKLGIAARSVMLVLRAPREDTRNPVAIAARLFDLTPAQVQVLAFLSQGHAPDAIAEILGVTVATVRTHLAELFRRTGTTRQAELVARTLSVASPLREPDAGG